MPWHLRDLSSHAPFFKFRDGYELCMRLILKILSNQQLYDCGSTKACGIPKLQLLLSSAAFCHINSSEDIQHVITSGSLPLRWRLNNIPLLALLAEATRTFLIQILSRPPSKINASSKSHLHSSPHLSNSKHGIAPVPHQPSFPSDECQTHRSRSFVQRMRMMKRGCVPDLGF